MDKKKGKIRWGLRPNIILDNLKLVCQSANPLAQDQEGGPVLTSSGKELHFEAKKGRRWTTIRLSRSSSERERISKNQHRVHQLRR